MLVLTRGPNESIVVGDRIEITVLEVKGGKVRIGIQAPASVPVHRKEVWLEIQKANLEAAKSAADSLDALTRLLDEKKKEKGT
jgi:carbon storage regulator